MPDPEHFLSRGLCLAGNFVRVLVPVLGPEDLYADHPVVADLIEALFDLLDRQNAGAGVKTMGIRQPLFGQVLSVVDVEDEQLLRVHRIDRLEARIARIEMEGINHVAHAVPAHPFNDLAAEIEGLNRAIGLSEKLESERNSVRLGNVR